MENLIKRKEDSHIFDLKGSKVGRFVKEIADPLNPPLGIVLKDVNFEQFAYKIVLDPLDKASLISVIIDDFLILKNCGIMDYSILLCIRKSQGLDYEESRLSFLDLEGNVVTLGIIDIFQEYNVCKMGETFVKTLLNMSGEVSSIEPQMYFERIKEYLSKIVI